MKRKINEKKCSKSGRKYDIIHPVQKTHHITSKDTEMERRNYIKNPHKMQHQIDNNFRMRLRGMVDQHQHEHPRTKQSYRFPTKVWGEILGVDPATVRRELSRGKARHGNEFEGGFHYVYDPEVSKRKAISGTARKGRKSLLITKSNDKVFAEGIKVLIELLLRKSTLPKSEGYYSVYAAIVITMHRVPGFTISEKTVWNWLKKGLLKGLTVEKVRIWKKKKKAPDKQTVPHNVKAKINHHLSDRPKEADDPLNPFHYEGDTICSCKGDTTAICSVIERTSNFQHWLKMSRNTSQCFNGAMKVIVSEEGSFKSITFDNGMEMSAVKKLERIIANGRSSEVFRCFYADAYASNQRAKNEKNHVFFRRFAGHGHLSSLSQKNIRHITDFVNDYPRRKFYGKSAREIHDEIRNGITPKIKPNPPKKLSTKRNREFAA